MKKKLDLTCPDCEGKRVDKEGNKCILCGGTGYFSDLDSDEDFTYRYDFNG